MVNKLFVLHADLGAAKNIIKNILLLSPDVYFPGDTQDRLAFMLRKIYNPRPLATWFTAEYRLKNYPEFGIDFILGDADVGSIVNLPDAMRVQLSKTNFALDLYNRERIDEVIDLPWVKFLCIYPRTELGVRWQVRAYVSKKTEKDMHNFTYQKSDNILRHKNLWGTESWTKVNTYNFYQSVLQHKNKLEKSGWPGLELEQILYPQQWPILINFLRQYFKITLNLDDSICLLQAWTDLHWKVDETEQWQHNDIFDGSRTSFSDDMICNHSC